MLLRRPAGHLLLALHVLERTHLHVVHRTLLQARHILRRTALANGLDRDGVQLHTVFYAGSATVLFAIVTPMLETPTGPAGAGSGGAFGVGSSTGTGTCCRSVSSSQVEVEDFLLQNTAQYLCGRVFRRRALCYCCRFLDGRNG